MQLSEQFFEFVSVFKEASMDILKQHYSLSQDCLKIPESFMHVPKVLI
jgi:hypothetical protein